MPSKYKLSAAGNIEAPAYKILINLGFRVTNFNSLLKAENEEVVLIGGSMIEVLGLANLYEKKGENWQVENDIIEEYINQFY